ncbi:MAG: glycine cleavage system protein GcvH [Actinomycetes bacterium]
MEFPDHLSYTAEHEWLYIDGEIATVGVTTFAADSLGDIVFVDLPAVGSTIVAGQPCGEIESTKSVSDLYAPVDGQIVEINQAVVDAPGLINADPFDKGWLFRVAFSEAPQLLDAAAYDALNGGS